MMLRFLIGVLLIFISSIFLILSLKTGKYRLLGLVLFSAGMAILSYTLFKTLFY
jgi:hypothetical protein